jgi:hypothetical protein
MAPRWFAGRLDSVVRSIFDSVGGNQARRSGRRGMLAASQLRSQEYSPTTTVDGPQIPDGAITARNIGADALQTSNYTYSGTLNETSEVAETGAKMQKDGTALLVAKENLKIGSILMDSLLMLDSAVVSNAETGFTISFATTLPDTNYAALAIPIYHTGSPVSDSYIIVDQNKGTSSVGITLKAAPGTGNAVYWEVVRIRLP